jgi:hypothetical protein
MLANLLSKRITRFLLAITAGLVIIAAGLAAYPAILAGGVQVKESLKYPPRINITQGEYEQALARWKAQKIEEYKITTDTRAFLGGTLTVHVSAFGNKVEELAPDGSSFDMRTPDAVEYLKKDTVEGLFATIDAILKDNDVFKTGAMTTFGNFYMAYQVSFDPRLGYPSHIVGRPITDPGAFVADADWDETVTSLEIIKQGK